MGRGPRFFLQSPNDPADANKRTVAVANVDAQVETLRAASRARQSPRSTSSSTTSSSPARARRGRCASPSNGVDLDAITAVTQAVSPILDDAPELTGSFLLEVSSPGVERVLRTPAHYAGAHRRHRFRSRSAPSPARAACTARSSTPDDDALHGRGRRRARGARVRRHHAGAHRVRVGTAAAPRASDATPKRGRAAASKGVTA